MHVRKEEADWAANLLTLARLFFIALTVLFVGFMVNPRMETDPAGRAAEARCFFIAL